jgi:predicted nucleotidyltransferase
MFDPAIDVPVYDIIVYGEQHPATRKLSMFGSVLRDDFGPDRGVDVLIEFDPDAKMSLFGMGEIRTDLMDLIGREIDLKTPGFPGDGICDNVMRSRVTVYDQPDH